MHAGEERKLVTILFADLVGSTARANDVGPERVRGRLARSDEQFSRLRLDWHAAQTQRLLRGL